MSGLEKLQSVRAFEAFNELHGLGFVHVDAFIEYLQAINREEALQFLVKLYDGSKETSRYAFKVAAYLYEEFHIDSADERVLQALGIIPSVKMSEETSDILALYTSQEHNVRVWIGDTGKNPYSSQLPDYATGFNIASAMTNNTLEIIQAYHQAIETGADTSDSKVFDFSMKLLKAVPHNFLSYVSSNPELSQRTNVSYYKGYSVNLAKVLNFVLNHPNYKKILRYRHSRTPNISLAEVVRDCDNKQVSQDVLRFEFDFPEEVVQLSVLEKPIRIVRLASLNEVTKIKIVKKCFDKADCFNGLDPKTREALYDMLAQIMGALSFTQEGDKLLKQIYREYGHITDLAYVPLFKVLHRRTNNPDVIQEELKCALFAHWGLRAVAMDSEYTRMIIEEANRNNSWIPYDLPEPVGLIRDELDNANVVEHAGQILDYQVLQEGLSFIRFAGNDLLAARAQCIWFLEDCVRQVENKPRHTPSSVTGYDRNKYLLDRFGSISRTNQYSQDHVFKYLEDVFGAYFKVDEAHLLDLLRACQNDPVSFKKDIIELIGLIENNKKIELSSQNLIDKFIALQGFQVIPETLEDKLSVLKEVYEKAEMFDDPNDHVRADRVIEGVRGSGNHLLTTFSPHQASNYFDKYLLIPIYGSGVHGLYPIEYYGVDNLDTKREIAITILKAWAKENKVSYDEICDVFKVHRKIWNTDIVRARRTMTINWKGREEKVIYRLNEMFRAAGLDSDADNRNNWTYDQLMTLQEIGITDAPHPDRVKDTKTRLFYRVTEETLTFEQLVIVLKKVIKRKFKTPDQLGNGKGLNNKDLLRFDIKDFSFMPEDSEIQTNMKALIELFRVYLLMHKKGLTDISRVNKFNVRSNIKWPELMAALTALVYDVKSFEGATESDILDVLEEYGLTGVIASIGDDATDVADYLSLFHQELIERYGLDELVEAFLGLKANQTEDTREFRRASPPREEEFTKAILEQLSHQESVTEETLQRVELIYRRILRRWAEKDPNAVMEWLSERVDHLGNESLEIIFTRLFDYFNGYLDFTPPASLTTSLYGYQTEAVRLFSSDEHKRGILADEPGMGKSIQAIGVVEASPNVGKVLWVTINSNKHTVKGEVLAHTNRPNEEVMVLDSATLARDLRNHDGVKYLVINYEALRKLKEKDPEGYASLVDGLDMVILDEGQVADNDASQQGEAVKHLAKQVDRFLILSATPIQNRFERFYNQLHLVDPKEFPDDDASRKLFVERYTKRGIEGYLELHHLLQRKNMLRRLKSDTHSEADPNIPLSEQPKALPKKNHVSYEVDGGYNMSREQADLYLLAVTDFEAFVEKYYSDKTQAQRKKIANDHLFKYRVLFDVVTQPEKFGIENNPRKQELKRLIKKAILSGEKVIVWAHHQHVIEDIVRLVQIELSEELKDKYPEGIGVARYNGSDEAIQNNPDYGIPQREVDLRAFQASRDSQPMVMVASYETAGIGLTMTAAGVSIAYEHPNMFTREIQAIDRNHRVDGRFPRYTIDYYKLVAMFPPGYLDEIEDDEIRLGLSNGSIEEHLIRKMQQLINKYGVVLDGIATEEDLDARMREDLLGDVIINIKERTARQTATEAPTYATKRMNRISRNAATLAASYQAYQAAPQKQQAVTEMVGLFNQKKIDFEDFVQLMSRLGENQVCITALRATLSIRKKYYTQRFLRAFMPLLDKAHAEHTTVSNMIAQNAFLNEVIMSESVSDQVKALVLPLMALEHDKSYPTATVSILRTLLNIKERAYQTYWAGRLFVALSHLNEVKQNKPEFNVLKFFENMPADLSLASQKQFIENLYLWSHVAVNLSPRTTRKYLEVNKTQAMLAKELPNMAWEIIADNIEADYICNPCKRVFNEDPTRLLAIFNGMYLGDTHAANAAERLVYFIKKLNAGKTLDQARQSWHNATPKAGTTVIKNDLTNKINEKAYDEFINTFNQEFVTRYSDIIVDQEGQAVLLDSIEQSHAEILELFNKTLSERYSYSLTKLINKYVKLDAQRQNDLRQILIGLKIKKQGDSYTDKEKDFLASQDISVNEFNDNRSYYANLFDLVQRWGEALTWLKNKDFDNPKLRRHLSYLISNFEVSDDEQEGSNDHKFVNALETIESCLNDYQEHKQQSRLKDVVVYDTDDPHLMLQIGDFCHTVSNCLASDGAPNYLAAIPTRLGSKSQRLIVVKVGDSIAAMAMLKVRLDEAARPIYYLELSVAAGAYNFRDELVAHVIEKARKSCGYVPKVAVERRLAGGLKGNYEVIHGLGGYGQREYDEAFYNVHSTGGEGIKHKAKVIFDPNTIPATFIEPKPTLVAEQRLRHYGLMRTQKGLVDSSRLRTVSQPVLPDTTCGGGAISPNCGISTFDPLAIDALPMSGNAFGMPAFMPSFMPMMM